RALERGRRRVRRAPASRGRGALRPARDVPCRAASAAGRPPDPLRRDRTATARRTRPGGDRPRDGDVRGARRLVPRRRGRPAGDAGAVRRLPRRAAAGRHALGGAALPFPAPRAGPHRRRSRRRYGEYHPSREERGIRYPRMNAVTWVDAVLVVLVAVLTALGAKKQWVGLVVVVGGLVLLRPLLVIGAQDPWIAIAAGFLGGILLGLLARRLSLTGRGKAWPETVLGGIGGFALGMVLMAALVSSLPIQRNPANEREIFYPPRDGSTGPAQAFRRSPMVKAE